MEERLFGSVPSWVGLRRARGGEGDAGGAFRFTDATDNSYAVTRCRCRSCDLSSSASSSSSSSSASVVFIRQRQQLRRDPVLSPL